MWIELDHSRDGIARRGHVSAQLADQLEKSIVDGELRDYMYLPSMATLQQETGVARRTIQKAYALLVERGLVRWEIGVGYLIRRR